MVETIEKAIEMIENLNCLVQHIEQGGYQLSVLTHRVLT